MITLIVAVELFAKGLIATGTIDYLIEGTKHPGLPAYAIMIVVVAFISISSVVMGSGNAPFFAFAPLVPDFAQRFGISTILLLMPMQLSTGLARVMFPIAAVAITAVVVAVTGCSWINPFALVGARQMPSGAFLHFGGFTASGATAINRRGILGLWPGLESPARGPECFLKPARLRELNRDLRPSRS